jgi:hypothetical protein
MQVVGIAADEIHCRYHSFSDFDTSTILKKDDVVNSLFLLLKFSIYDEQGGQSALPRTIQKGLFSFAASSFISPKLFP